jgi:3'(2'),5'-bisphosphate nucleotidase
MKSHDIPYMKYADIIEVAHKAGAILLKYYERGDSVLAIENKNKDILDFVTQADKEADSFICEEIHKLFPFDTVVSEENFKSKDISFNGNAWFVDPLDGTKEFMFEGGRFSVMIGLCEEGVPVLGVVCNPLEEITYIGEKSKGAFSKLPGTEWKKLKVSNIKTISKATQIVRKMYDEKRDADTFIEELKNKSNITDASFGLRLGRIASGEAEFTINTNRRASKWDTCAAEIILEEAGGVTTDMFGEKLNYLNPGLRWTNSFVASNGLFHSEVIEECKKLAVLWGVLAQEKKD